jgi:hypothetical protein
MKRLVTIIILLLAAEFAYSQNEVRDYSSTELFLLTCSSGSKTYSMYGHSAIRLRDTLAGIDEVYNWGVFDFSTPNFTYKFARGRLDYLLGVYSYNTFLRDYFNEERSVISQRINLTDKQIGILKELLIENQLEENRYYRYDFFMDNCATRIRDILEQTLGDELIYPEYDEKDIPSYRERIDEYQGIYFPWLDMGIDLLLGSPADSECGFRESMFLPDYLAKNLSAARVSANSTAYPLLDSPVTILDFDKTIPANLLLLRPWFILSLLSLVLIFATFRIKNTLVQNLFDIVFFTVFMGLSFVMIFTNYLTDHLAMGNNFNMIWLNPLLLFAPVIMFFKKNRLFWQILVASILVFMVVIVFASQSINPAFIPIMVLLLSRCWYRLNSSTR